MAAFGLFLSLHCFGSIVVIAIGLAQQTYSVNVSDIFSENCVMFCTHLIYTGINLCCVVCLYMRMFPKMCIRVRY